MSKFNQKDISINIRLNSHQFRLFYNACKRCRVPYSRMIRLLIDKWTYQQYTSDSIIDFVELTGVSDDENK